MADRKKDTGCSPDCSYRTLYDGTQSSLLSMTAKHAENLQRVQKLRSSVIKVMKSNYPRLFSELEMELGDQMRNVDDRLLMIALEQIMIRSQNKEVDLSDLRRSLEAHGFALPQEDSPQLWATLLTSQEPVRKNTVDPEVEPLNASVTASKDSRFPTFPTADRVLSVVSTASDPLDELGFHFTDSAAEPTPPPTGIAFADIEDLFYPERQPDDGPTPPTEQDPEAEVHQDDPTEKDLTPPSDAPTGSTSNSLNEEQDSLDDLFEDVTPTPKVSPQTEDPTDSIEGIFEDLFTSDSENPPLEVAPPPATAVDRNPNSEASATDDTLLDLFSTTPTKENSTTNDTPAASDTPPTSHLTAPATSQLQQEKIIPSDGYPTTSSPLRPMLGVPTRTKRSTSSKRKSTWTAQGPAEPTPPPDMSPAEKRELNALLSLPRPVFLTDIAHILGEERSHQWFDHIRTHRESGIRFLSAKARWKDGPMLITTPDNQSPLQKSDSSGWAKMLLAYRGSHLYAAGQLMKRLNTNVISTSVQSHAFGMLVQDDRTVYAIVTCVGDDYSPNSQTRTQLTELVTKYQKSRLHHIDILTTSGQKHVLDSLRSAVIELVPMWNPKIPIRVGFTHTSTSDSTLVEVFTPTE